MAPWTFTPVSPCPGPSPRVAVVMAAKNYGRFVAQAIESVLAQTVTDWELVVVNDGSTDDTAAVVGRYLVDPRIRVVHADRLGQPRAKNLGVRLTTAPLVAFLDADDAWHPEKLAWQLPQFRDPRLGLSYCFRTVIDESGRPLPAQPAGFLHAGPTLPAIFAKNFVCFSSAVIRREAFELAGGFDPGCDLAIDYDLWLRVAAHTEFGGVPERLVEYRTGHANLSKRLCDRVLTAQAIMTRALTRRNLARRLPRRLVGEGYASLDRVLAYTLSRGEPGAAIRAYTRSLGRPGARRLTAVRGLVRAVLQLGHPRRTPLAGENATANR